MKDSAKSPITTFLFFLIFFLVIVLGAYALSKDIVNFAYSVYLVLLGIYHALLNLYHILTGLGKL